MDETCVYKRACYALAAILVLLVILVALGYVEVKLMTKENLNNDQITDALVYRVLTQDPQNSAAVMRSLSPEERQKYMERFTGLPYNPLYYKTN